MNFYCLVYKPFNVLSQFSPLDSKQTLKDFFDVPKDVYPVGRLDFDSEGLLLLTNDTAINSRLLNPSHAHAREYWVQVDGAITTEAINQLQKGVVIKIDGKDHRTLPCSAAVFKSDPEVPERNPPIRIRKSIPAPWIKITLAEGKNRQVRKMTAAVGFPTLRLIRYRIESCALDGLQPGEMRTFTKQQIYQLLFPDQKAPHKRVD
ncbi:MAG: pseudouridine synthase [Ferruginibacter sp.]|nr:pseudouridine synthase [Ferruginibacter sp.]